MASLMLRKPGAYPRQNGLAVALRELGKVERTLFLIPDSVHQQNRRSPRPRPPFVRSDPKSIGGQAQARTCAPNFLARLGLLMPPVGCWPQYPRSGVSLSRVM